MVLVVLVPRCLYVSECACLYVLSMNLIYSRRLVAWSKEYYANTGAMVRAMEEVRRVQGPKGASRGKVSCTVVEGFQGSGHSFSQSKGGPVKRLDEVLRLEYRTKLLNPKWAEAMVASGSGGAFEVSQRMTALIGWGATTGFQEGWVFDQAAQTYALDLDMAQRCSLGRRSRG